MDMLGDMVSPIVKSTGVQAPTILRPLSFGSNKVLFEYGLEQDAKSEVVCIFWKIYRACR